MLTLEACSDAVMDAARELSDAIGLGPLGVALRDTAAPPGVVGGYVAVVSPRSSVQVGIATTRLSAARIGALMLGLDEDDSGLEESELQDVLGELANILAGGLKRRLAEQDGGLELGLPIFVDGRFEVSSPREACVQRIGSDVGDCWLAVYVQNAAFGGRAR